MPPRSRGNLTELATGLKVPEVTGINAAGTVVGHGLTDDGIQAWTYRRGEYRALPDPPSLPGLYGTLARGINQRGDVAGNALDAHFGSHVVVWPAGGGQPRELPVPVGYEAATVGIADDGSVLASARRLSLSEYNSFRWTAQGVRQELPTTKPGHQASVQAVQGHWAAGSEYDPATGRITTVRWTCAPVPSKSCRPSPPTRSTTAATWPAGTPTRAPHWSAAPLWSGCLA